jgi:hypothetical protein
MDIYPTFLAIMAALFAVAAVVLLVMSIAQAASRNWRKALIYFGLMALSCIVAAGFRFFRTLF